MDEVVCLATLYPLADDHVSCATDKGEETSGDRIRAVNKGLSTGEFTGVLSAEAAFR